MLDKDFWFARAVMNCPLPVMIETDSHFARLRQPGATSTIRLHLAYSFHRGTPRGDRLHFLRFPANVVRTFALRLE